MANKYYFKIDGGVKYDELLAGPEEKIMLKNVKVAAGAEIERGMLLSENENGEVKQAEAEDTDKPLYIAYESLTSYTTAVPLVTTVYSRGRFNRSRIKVAAGVDLNKFEEALRKENILLTDIMEQKVGQ